MDFGINKHNNSTEIIHLKGLLEGVTAATASVTIVVLSHEDTSTADRAFTSQASNLTRFIDLVELENSKLHLLVNMLNLLGGLVLLLLMLLTTTTKTEDQVKSGFLLDVVIGESATVFKLLTSEDQTLLIWGNSFLVLDLGLDVFDGIRGFDVEGNSLSYKLAPSHPEHTSKSLNENLHRKPI